MGWERILPLRFNVISNLGDIIYDFCLLNVVISMSILVRIHSNISLVLRILLVLV